MRIIETKIEIPNEPSHTFSTIKIIKKYISELILSKINIDKNKINTINSNLNKVEIKCLRLDVKIKHELMKINIKI